MARGTPISTGHSHGTIADAILGQKFDDVVVHSFLGDVAGEAVHVVGGVTVGVVV